jgi:hypothetical protein
LIASQIIEDSKTSPSEKQDAYLIRASARAAKSDISLMGLISNDTGSDPIPSVSVETLQLIINDYHSAKILSQQTQISFSDADDLVLKYLEAVLIFRKTGSPINITF